MLVDRHVRAVVIAHDTGRIAVFDATPGQGRGRIGDEAAHAPAGDLLVDGHGGVVRVHIQGRRAEVVNRVGAPLILVGEPRAKAVDVRAPAC